MPRGDRDFGIAIYCCYLTIPRWERIAAPNNTPKFLLKFRNYLLFYTNIVGCWLASNYEDRFFHAFAGVDAKEPFFSSKKGPFSLSMLKPDKKTSGCVVNALSDVPGVVSLYHTYTRSNW